MLPPWISKLSLRTRILSALSLMKRKLSPDSARMTTTPQLDPLEKQLKHLLLDVAAHIDKTAVKKPGDQVILRWAGGWVRDKLLGRPSHDIDVAINCMTGEVFGNELRSFCECPENTEKHNLQPEDVGRLHKIARNPEKSKQLETATVKLFGLDVDFVNLRTETYTEDSRNPQVEFGTPEQDALRRDATVNALFYNIHTGEVEDFVGGMPDLKAGIIRTPMDPFQTFMDDPLRVLRLVRFASRLGFSIAPSTREFMGNVRVLAALRAKISRERVGIEVEKMLRGENPRDAVHLIDHLGLYHTIFTYVVNLQMPQPSLEGWRAAYEFLHNSAKETGSVYNVLVTSDDARYYAWNLVCFVPFARLPSPTPVDSKKHLPPAAVAAREGIKATNKLSDLVTAAVCHREEICEFKSLVLGDGVGEVSRERLGMAIRGWEARGAHWRLQVLFAFLYDMILQSKAMPEPHATPDTPDTASVPPETEFDQGLSALEGVQREWKAFLDYVRSLDLMDAPSMKPVIDGRKLLKALNIKNPGPWMTPALDICMTWQLRFPGETDLPGAIEEVRQRKEELGIPT